VKDFVETPAGAVPRVHTKLSWRDRFGTFRARLGITRNNYKVTPGLYCVGSPTPESPVVATANYKLTFDIVRKEMNGLDAWLLILDTRGINVWCAAGKQLFSTEELARRILLTQLADIVSHRQVIVPQLAATGIAAHKLNNLCDFKAIYSPVRASDLKSFIKSGYKADETMRSVTFTLRERAVLVPVEFWILRKYIFIVSAIIFALSGIGPGIFSFAAAWSRGAAALAAGGAGIFAGACLTPILLPWLPGRQFWIKGIVTGLPLSLAVSLSFSNVIGTSGIVAATLFATAASSYLAMNFTGSTPYTSPSGVEKEMRRGIPAQALAALAALALWIGSGFTGGAA